MEVSDPYQPATVPEVQHIPREGCSFWCLYKKRTATITCTGTLSMYFLASRVKIQKLGEFVRFTFELLELKFRDSVWYFGDDSIFDICPDIKISKLLHTLTVS